MFYAWSDEGIKIKREIPHTFIMRRFHVDFVFDDDEQNIRNASYANIMSGCLLVQSANMYTLIST